MNPIRITSLPRLNPNVIASSRRERSNLVLKQIASSAFGLLAMTMTLSSAFAAREIAVTAAVSSEFKKNPEWQTDIRDRVLFANQIFEKQLGIHFTVRGYIDWEPEDETRAMSLLLEELYSLKSPGPDEIVAGFHRMSKPFGKDNVEDIDTVGSARFFQGVAVLRDPHAEMAQPLPQVILTHEFGHLFGAVHIGGDNQIMHASAVPEPAPAFDADNAEIVRLSGGVDFQKGIASLSDAAIDGLIQIYERLIRANPHSDFYLQLGKFYRRRGQPARAVAVWEEAVRQRYDNPMIHHELGLYYFRAGRYEAAIQELGSAVAHFVLKSQQKDKAAAFNALGVAYYYKGSHEQSVFNWLKGLSVDPDNRDLQGNLAAAYLEAGDFDRGLAELQKLAVKYPKDAMVWSNLGVAALRKKDFPKAKEAFERALQLQANEPVNTSSQAEPENVIREVPLAESHMNLGIALLEMGEPAAGTAELEKARSLDAQNFSIYRNLAHAYMAAGQPEKVLAVAEEGYRLKKDDPYLYALQAQAFAAVGKNAEAIQTARKALPWADDKLKGELHRNIGALLAQAGRWTEAQAELKDAINLNWNDADAHTNLAYTYAQNGNWAEARRSFETALRIKPDHAAARKGLDQLAQVEKQNAR